MLFFRRNQLIGFERSNGSKIRARRFVTSFGIEFRFHVPFRFCGPDNATSEPYQSIALVVRIRHRFSDSYQDIALAIRIRATL